MQRRLILAIALSLLVLLSWSALVTKVYHIDNKGVAIRPAAPILIKPQPQGMPLAPAPEPAASSLWKFSQQNYDVVFDESRAAIKEVVFKTFQNYAFPLKYAFFLADENLIFQKETVTPESVSFIYRSKEKQVTKKFIFSNSNYTIGLEIKVQNLSVAPLRINLPLILGVLNFNGDPTQARFRDVTVATKEKILHPSANKEAFFSEVKFLGLREQYFCAILEPNPDNYSAFIKKIAPKEVEVGLNVEEFTLLAGEAAEKTFRIYLGPQQLQQINQINPHWTAVMYYGTFDLVAQGLLHLLDILYKLAHNWGVVIVILSLLIYFLLYPLTLKQMRSMKEMQALQPHIEELRKLYKDNPQKLNTETMKLYREHKVNPFGGCLPLILQIPVFFALYQVLIRSVALKGAKFLWIQDLSKPDRLFTLPASVPIIGNEINILPILMTVGMFIQQKTSMATATGTSAEQQKLMLILFPLMFGFIFYHMPSGLVLYWSINSALMLFYQLRITRHK